MDYCQREQEAYQLELEEETLKEERKKAEKARRAKDTKDYEAMLLDLVRTEVRGL